MIKMSLMQIILKYSSNFPIVTEWCSHREAENRLPNNVFLNPTCKSLDMGELELEHPDICFSIPHGGKLTGHCLLSNCPHLGT